MNQHSQAMKDFKPRLKMTIICVLFLCLFIGFALNPYFKPLFVAAVGAVGACALWEYFQIAKLKGVIPSTKLGIISAFFYAYAVFFSTLYPFLDFLPFAVLGLILTILFISHFNEIERALTSIAVTFFGLCYIVVTFSLIITIIYFFPETSQKDGRLWLIYLLAVTKMTDIGGLFIGRFFGKSQLMPKISPNKTVAGAIGGIIFSCLTSLCFAAIAGFDEQSPLGISLGQSLFLGIIIGIFAEVGDLAESLLKRDGKIKDSNSYIPGLGGILDLIDSLIFTIPIVYLFLRVAIK